ncbi:uncharacterized protein LOC143228356 [Tachypleus tridentatus]|uniref:uncharacterized protein LOC143228356 n=1 Tax=Tachypleus tridentatus TaxID=6853 RepID=UPI003FD160B4
MKSTPDLDDFGVISGNAERDEEKQKNKVSTISSLEKLMVEPHSGVSERPQSPTTTVFSIRGLSPLTTLTSPKKGHRREEGWKEVIQKISVPSSAISRVIGKGGCNINTICEVSGAHIEVEKQKGQGDRTLIIRGSQEATRQANQLIASLIKEANCELPEIIANAGLSNSASTSAVSVRSEGMKVMTEITTALSTLSKLGMSHQLGTLKSSSNTSLNISQASAIPPPSLPMSVAAPFSNQPRLPGSPTFIVRPPICVSGTVRAPPFPTNYQNAWVGTNSLGKSLTVTSSHLSSPWVPLSVQPDTLQAIVNTTTSKCPAVRLVFPKERNMIGGQNNTTINTKATVSYTIADISQRKFTKTLPIYNNTVSIRPKLAAADTKLTLTALSQLGHLTATASNSIQSSTEFLPTHSLIQPFPLPESSSHTRTQNNKMVIQSSQTSVAQHQTKITGGQPVMQQTLLTNGVRGTEELPVSQYTPFHNHFSKVVEHSVWGQKETKPNFASVAAAGITSVAMNTQSSNPIKTSVSLSLPQTTDYKVDAAKAPGYRGNLHVSPCGLSNSFSVGRISQAVSVNTNYRLIGSGPQSAPCTPPLGPIGTPSSSNPLKHGISVIASLGESRSSPDSRHFLDNEMDGSCTVSSYASVSRVISDSHMTAETLYQSQAMQGLNMNLPMNNHFARIHDFSPALGVHFPGPSLGTHTDTTFSQHTPLSSVGSVASDSTSDCSTTHNTNSHVFQSNLNPNAPDFSSRTSLLVAHQNSHGPSVASCMTNVHAPYHESTQTAQNPGNMIHVIAGGANVNHQLPFHNGFFAPNGKHYPFPFSHVQQNLSEYNPPPGPVGSIPPSMAGPGFNAEALKLITTMGGFLTPPNPAQAIQHPVGVLPHHFTNMAQVVELRQNQISTYTTPSIGTSSKDGDSPVAVASPSGSPQGSNLGSPVGVGSDRPGVVCEDRKLPRPIGTERAQKKNPTYGSLSDVPDIWSYGANKINDVSSAEDWIHHMPSGIAAMQTLSQDDPVPHMLHNSYMSGRYGENLVSVTQQNSSLEQSYQSMNIVTPGGGYSPYLNGVPVPHVLTTHLYSHANGGLATGMEVGGELWHAPSKVVLPNIGDNLPCDHKMAWHKWNQHLA